MDGPICRLCLRTTLDNFTILDDDLRDTLDNFILKSVLNASLQKSMVCSECRNNLELFCNFKRSCVDQTLPGAHCRSDFNTDLEDIENTHMKPVVNDTITCNFCTKIVGKSCFISIIELKKSSSVVNMLGKHNPELNLSNREQIVSCESCQNSLQKLQGFITNYFDVEEQIRKYVKVEGVDDTGKIDLRKVQEFTLKPTVEQEIGCCSAIKKEITDGNPEVFAIKSEPELKCENEDDPEPIIKYEEVDIKLEEDEDDDESKGSKKLQTSTFRGPLEDLDIPVYKCYMCTYKTKRKKLLRQHLITHKDPSEKIKYKCNECAFETLYQTSIRLHMLTHKDPSDMTMVKCEMCTFETKHKKNMKRHMSTHDTSVSKKSHNDPSEVTMHKCELCTYQSRVKKNFKQHLLTHTDRSERKKIKRENSAVYKCLMCTYRTRHSYLLNRHMLTHKDHSEREKYKCKDCPYETITKSAIKRHTMTHRDLSTISIHKCEACTYETMYAENMRRHILVHKDPSERKRYKCNNCAHETITSQSMKRHLLTHKDPSEVTMHKCELCAYETKHIGDLKQHMMSKIHKQSSSTKERNTRAT